MVKTPTHRVNYSNGTLVADIAITPLQLSQAQTGNPTIRYNILDDFFNACVENYDRVAVGSRTDLDWKLLTSITRLESVPTGRHAQGA